MKCIVIYFSQTGNTEKIAKAIQKGVNAAAGNCDIGTVKDINPKRLDEYDLIGFGTPTWGGEPPNCSAFINDMRFVGGKHIFSFCTHGGNVEHYFPIIYPKLIRKGLKVIGMRDWYGDVFLLHYPETYPTEGHPDEIDLKEAAEWGKEMVERSKRISAGETNLMPPAPEKNPPLPFTVDRKPDHFSATLKYSKERCIYPECRLCMDNCPVSGFDLTVDPPVIAKPCIECEFCARLCPTGALDMSIWVQAMADIVREKLFPYDLLPTLQQAETAGKFRRILPEEKLDLDTYGYVVHTNHPQYIIGKGPQ
jgi:flavodoxin/NAD-dependent dihydropyrimidine dehydrogenase PreA subunit